MQITSRKTKNLLFASYLMLFAAVALAISPAVSAKKATDKDQNSLSDQVKGFQHLEGFYDLYWDESKGRLLLLIDNLEDPFIYQSSMPRGVGSNDLGLDRGQLGDTKIVSFYRSGPKVLLVQKNLVSHTIMKSMIINRRITNYI